MTQISSHPAQLIDYLQLRRGDTTSGFLLSEVLTRVIGTVIFPITTLIDSITNFSSASYQKIYSIFPTGEEAQTAYAKSAHKAAISGARHLAAFIATPSELIRPGTISHHFIPLIKDAKDLIRPYGRLYEGKGDLREPRTISEVQKIVNEARSKKKQVAISGAGFSQGKHIISIRGEDIHINLRKMNDVRVNPSQKTATVSAGATWAEVQRAVNEHGLAIQTMQASNVFSIGGSLGINCHGWDIRAGALGNTVRSLTVVDAHGEVKVVTKEDELFRLINGGVGMFGVIVSAEIELADNVEMERSGEAMRPADYLNYFRGIQGDDDVKMHLASLSLTPGHLFEEVVAENYKQISDEPHVSPVVEHPEEGSDLERIALQYARNRRWVKAVGWTAKKSDICTPRIATRNEHMDFPIQAMFNHSKSQSDWLQEYFVPPHQLNLFIQKLKKTLETNSVRLYNASIRYVPQDDSSEFSYAKDGEKFAIVLCFAQSLAPDQIEKTEKWVQEITDYLSEHEGTYYLPYQQFATKKQFRACHPEWASAQNLKRKYDPHNVFYSGFGKQYVDISDQVNRKAGILFNRGELLTHKVPAARPKKDARPSFYRTVFSDLEKRTQFSAFLQNIFKQLDIKPFFALIDDILAYASTDEEIYKELQRRIGEAQGGAIKTAFRAIGALRDQVSAVGKQFAQIVPEDKSFDGYVELETPGRFVRELKKQRSISGRITVVNHNRSAKDYIEAGFPLPFHEYVPLNGYKPLDPERLENASVELVTCFKGLHHIKPEGLEDFVKSIHRILKPGGSFVLRDHNADTEDMFAMVDVVHSIFNAATDEPWDVEKAEVRNFNSLTYWRELLERNGFRAVSDGQVRGGDPTANTLLRFEKIETELEQSLNEAQKHFQMDPGYRGNEVGMTFQAAEWENVLAAQRYAEVIKKVPFYEFKFMQHLGQFWKVFGEAWAIEREKHTLFELFTSYYTYMILFVGINMTIEYSIKAAISAPLLWMFGQSDGRPNPIQLVVEDPDGRTLEVDDRVEIKERIKGTNLVRIELRRFYEMKEFIERASRCGIRPLELAGSKQAQLRLFIPSEKPDALKGIDGLRLLFQWDDVENEDKKLAQVRVQVAKLPEILKEFDRRNIELEFIHDS